MTTRTWLAGAIVAGVACTALLLVESGTGAAEAGPPSARWGTQLGVPVPWPAGLDPDCIHRLAYSPSGRYLGVKTVSNRPALVDLVGGAWWDLYSGSLADRPNLQCADLQWVTDGHLYLVESWVPDEEHARLLDPNSADNGALVQEALGAVVFRQRIVDWANSATLLELPTQINGQTLEVLGFESEHQWIVRDWSEAERLRRLWRFDPVSRSLTGVLAECDENETRRAVRGPWLVKFLVPGDAPLWEQSFDMSLINYQTGETRLVPGVPPYVRSPKITADGRYVVALTRDPDNVCPLAITIFDTTTGQWHVVPPGESWIAHAVSESRGTVLAALGRQRVDGSWTSDWVEIPLSALLGG